MNKRKNKRNKEESAKRKELDEVLFVFFLQFCTTNSLLFRTEERKQKNKSFKETSSFV
jgi:hypothetical protein